MRNYFDDEPASPAPEAAEESQEPKPENEANTALLPKAVFAGREVQPGDTCEFTVTRVLEDEVQVAYKSSESEEAEEAEEEEPAEEAEAPAPESPMAGLME